MRIIIKFTLLIMLGLSCQTASANDFKPQIEHFFQTNVSPWLSNPAIIDMVKAQNKKNAALTPEEIDALDKKWRAQASADGGELISSILSNSLSKFLSDKKATHKEAITEIFVMDAKGLNVGQSDVTSDYMQGDEAKWKNTYGTGQNKTFIDEVEFDESSQSFQSQISSTIIDPATGKPIGAITIGLNVESLM